MRQLTALLVAAVALAAASAPALGASPRGVSSGQRVSNQHRASNLARIEIPKIGLDAPLGVVPDLDHGPGFYPSTGRPGRGRTIAIAGHRTTHTRPFWAIDELRRGDSIVIFWSGRRFVYRVTSLRIVKPSDWSIVRNRGYERLVLSSCNPRFSAKQRIVVFAVPRA
jgi:sortase A